MRWIAHPAANPVPRLHARHWTLAAFLVALALLVFAAVRSHQHSRSAADAEARVAHTLQVLRQTLAFEQSVAQLEAEHRGFLITGDEAFLAARDRQHAEAVAQLAALRARIDDTSVQQARLDRIGAALDSRYAHMRETSRLVPAIGLEAGRQRFAGEGVALVAPLDELLAELRGHEERLLAERAGEAVVREARLRRLLLVAQALALALLLAALILLWHALRASERSGQALAEAGAMQRAFLDGAGLMVIATRPDGTIHLFNRAASEQLGYEPGELVGRQTPVLFHDADELAARARRLSEELGEAIAPGFEVFVARTLREGRESRRWTYVRRDGSRFPVQLTVSAVRTPDGVLRGYVGLAEDISGRVEAERRIRQLNERLQAKAAQLEATNRELESFSYSVSHDLRAPLRHIDGYARMLSEDVGDRLEDEPRRHLAAITAAARRMGTLIDDLLAFSRLGRKPVERRPVDMRRLVDEALAELAGGEATIVVGELPAAEGDPALLKQVWTNLLSNAIKYSAPRGAAARIEVAGQRCDHRIRYRVRDNGVGFDMRYADKLFGVFQRLHAQDEFEGTGVGLAIVHRIVARHGGRISADARPGDGAEFAFELPASGAAA